MRLPARGCAAAALCDSSAAPATATRRAKTGKRPLGLIKRILGGWERAFDLVFLLRDELCRSFHPHATGNHAAEWDPAAARGMLASHATDGSDRMTDTNTLRGTSLIAGARGRMGGRSFRALNPSTGAAFEPEFHEASDQEVAHAMEADAQRSRLPNAPRRIGRDSSSALPTTSRGSAMSSLLARMPRPRCLRRGSRVSARAPAASFVCSPGLCGKAPG